MTEQLAFARYVSPFGDLILAADGEALIGCWFTGQKYFGQPLLESQIPKDCLTSSFKSNISLQKAKDWLDAYFKKESADLPKIKFQGTAFQNEVWAELLLIPRGASTTYGEIAKNIARRRGLPRFSAQAVGGAVGHNPFSLLVPCHRVLGAGQSLTGYAGGIDLKAKLLTFEGVEFNQ